MTDTAELERRLSEATAEIDDDLGCRMAVFGQGEVVSIEGPHRGDFGGDEYAVRVDLKDGSGRREVFLNVSEFPTRSIDAALALVERKLPGWVALLDQYRDRWEVNLALWKDDKQEWTDVEGTGPTAPLAILIALIRALATNPQEPT